MVMCDSLRGKTDVSLKKGSVSPRAHSFGRAVSRVYDANKDRTTHLNPRICTASLRSIFAWKPPLTHSSLPTDP